MTRRQPMAELPGTTFETYETHILGASLPASRTARATECR
jgi:hypothetical protein